MADGKPGRAARRDAVPVRRQTGGRTAEVRPSRLAAAFALAAALAVALLGWRVAQLPRLLVGQVPAAIRATGEAVGDAAGAALGRLAAAIASRRVLTEFTSTATRLQGTNRLEVAELSQVEVVDRREEARILGLALPDVVVEARVPVTYTYHVDLAGPWDFRLTGKTVGVVAPPLGFGMPAVDVSRLTFRKVETSIFRDEDAVVEELRLELMPALRRRARQNVPLVRETARRQVEEFVRTWLLRAYGTPDDVRVAVRFQDEPPPAPAGPRVRPLG